MTGCNERPGRSFADARRRTRNYRDLALSAHDQSFPILAVHADSYTATLPGGAPEESMSYREIARTDKLCKRHSGTPAHARVLTSRRPTRRSRCALRKPRYASLCQLYSLWSVSCSRYAPLRSLGRSQGCSRRAGGRCDHRDLHRSVRLLQLVLLARTARRAHKATTSEPDARTCQSRSLRFSFGTSLRFSGLQSSSRCPVSREPHWASWRSVELSSQWLLEKTVCAV